MKKLFCFLAVASTAAFTSCSSDDSGDNNPPVDAVTSITLTSNVESVILGEGSFTFSVADQGGNAITDATLTANDVAITSPWTPTAAGTFEIEATYGDLTDNVTVTVTEAALEASDSFVIDNVNFETPIALFGYRGIYETATGSGEYVIVYDFNPFLQEGTEEQPTFPNDLYIGYAWPIEPTGEDENGDPLFTIEDPSTGTFTFTGNNINKLVIIADNNDLSPANAEAVQEITLNIESVTWTQEGSTVEATYTVTLTNGTIIEGEYSGETGIYDATQQGRNINAKTVKISTGNFVNSSGKISGFRK